MCECVAMKNQRPWLCVQLPVYAVVYRSIGNAPTVDRHVYAVHIGRCSCIFGWFRVEWGKGSKQHMTFFVDFSFFFRQPLQERINWRNNKRSEMSNTSTVDLMHSNETKKSEFDAYMINWCFVYLGNRMNNPISNKKRLTMTEMFTHNTYKSFKGKY